MIYRDDLPNSVDEIVFRILLFKLFNKIETWERLERALGPISFADYRFDRYDKILTKAMAEGLASRGIPESSEAQEVAALVNRAIAQTRQLARGLYPTELEQEGLPTTN